jgi:TRAP-type mannitol/chloroaromatic compound transport system substrate-binding protein
LRQLKEEHGVDVRPLPDDVIARLRDLSAEVLEEIAAEDELAGRVYGSIKNYAETTIAWTDISERYILNHR